MIHYTSTYVIRMKVQTLFLNRKKEDTSFTKRFSKHKIGSKCKIQNSMNIRIWPEQELSEIRAKEIDYQNERKTFANLKFTVINIYKRMRSMPTSNSKPIKVSQVIQVEQTNENHHKT